jgi:hypothetical protein
VEVVAREVPRVKPLSAMTLCFRPWSSICERTKVRVDEDDSKKDNARDLEADAGTEGRGQEVEHRAPEQNREVKSGEIVVQEKLTTHKEEWQVVQRPPNEEETAEGIVLDNFGYNGR